MKMVFDEFYGELSFAQRAAYRKYGVSPADHSALLNYFDEDAHQEIAEYVKKNAKENNGVFYAFRLIENGV